MASFSFVTFLCCRTKKSWLKIYLFWGLTSNRCAGYEISHFMKYPCTFLPTFQFPCKKIPDKIFSSEINFLYAVKIFRNFIRSVHTLQFRQLHDLSQRYNLCRCSQCAEHLPRRNLCQVPAQHIFRFRK